MNGNSLGMLLRQRRALAQLSRARLARLAGLCEATIKFIEFGKQSDSTDTPETARGPRAFLYRQRAWAQYPTAAEAAAAPFVAALFHRIHKRIDRMTRRRIHQQEEHQNPKIDSVIKQAKQIEETESAAEFICCTDAATVYGKTIQKEASLRA